MKNALEFLTLLREGGSIVSSGSCSAMEISFARAAQTLFVDEDGFGYVYRLNGKTDSTIADVLPPTEDALEDRAPDQYQKPPWVSTVPFAEQPEPKFYDINVWSSEVTDFINYHDREIERLKALIATLQEKNQSIFAKKGFS